MAERQLRIIPGFRGYREGAICVGTNAPLEIVRDTSKFAFSGRGSPFDPGPTRLFYERVLLGQEMPSTLIMGEWGKIGPLLIAAIFMSPEIVLEPRCLEVVSSADLVERLGSAAYGHISPTHKDLFYVLESVVRPQEGINPVTESVYEVVRSCIFLIIRYVMQGEVPPMQAPPPEYEIVTTRGDFVAFRSKSYVWDHLYSLGYLWGVQLKGKGLCVISRKSPLVRAYGLSEEVLAARLRKETGREWKVTAEGVEGFSDDITHLMRIMFL